MIGFERQKDYSDLSNSATGLLGVIDEKWNTRLDRIRRAWNFYEGYHWEELPATDSPELCINYCRAFVNKYVAFELGKAFTFNVSPKCAEQKVDTEGRTLFEYLEDIWEDNNQYAFAEEMGQMKSVTGEAWVRVSFLNADEIEDPFEEYPNGRLKLSIIPTGVVFPEYDPHNRESLVRLTIMYQYERIDTTPLLGTQRKTKTIYKQEWTKDSCKVTDGNDIQEFENKYGYIPFVQINNLNIAGKSEGLGDLEDLIPLNVELNLKKSNISEIIDYHSAPITVVYGAKVGNLEKGANKLWGGLPKDARVENLTLTTDLGASNTYATELKLAMCEVGGIPETVLGGAQAISNTSGVALQYINLPLIERTRMKKLNTEAGIEKINKMIISISLKEGLINIPENISMRDFLFTDVQIPDTLPKDELLQLQQVQIELANDLESTKGALKRLGRENVEALMKEIEAEKLEKAKVESEITSLLGVPNTEKTSGNTPQLNSGMLNGQTPKEQMRIETTGSNGMTPQ